MSAAAARIRFRIRSNSTAGFDGLNLDAIRVVIFDPAAQPGPAAVPGGPAISRLELALPAPNPARTRVALEFALPRAVPARLEILDVRGRRVRRLAAGVLPAGRYVRGWDLTDDLGRRVAAGIYLARLSAAGEVASRRLVALP